MALDPVKLPLPAHSARFRAEGPVRFAGNPFYSAICDTIANDNFLLELASLAAPGEDPIYLLLGAVHFLLLSDGAHPLAEAYSRPKSPGAGHEAQQLLGSFCAEHIEAIRLLLESRSVQTNDAGRSALLVGGILKLEELLGRKALTLVDVGCSAGLNLNFDLFRFQFYCGSIGSGRSRTVKLGPPTSEVRIPCRVVGKVPFLTDAEDLPAIVGRLGIDLRPLDISVAEDVRWLEALVWPGQRRRLRILRSAVRVFRHSPRVLIEGDAVTELPFFQRKVSDGSDLLIFQSFVESDLRPGLEARLRLALAAISRDRLLRRCFVEWNGGHPELKIEVWDRGGCQISLALGTCLPDGSSLRIYDGGN